MTKTIPNSFYGRFNGFNFLRIPYEKGLDLLRFSMYFILPDEKDGLKVIAEKMNSDNGLFNQCFELDWEVLRELMIPKFKIKCEFAASDA